MNDKLTIALGLGPRKAATDERLRHVWERWRFLGDLSGHHKEQVVFTVTTYMWDQSMVEAASRLRERYGAFLDRETYETSVRLIRIWEELLDYVATTQQLHSQLILGEQGKPGGHRANRYWFNDQLFSPPPRK